MDGWVPKGGGGPGSLPPGDGAFERFLTAAIAAIITIMFSWRLLDDMNEQPVLDDEQARQRRAVMYAALARATGRPTTDSGSISGSGRQIAELDIDEDDTTGDVDGDNDSRSASDSRGACSLPQSDSGFYSMSSSVDGQEYSSVDLMKCFTSAPPTYLPTDGARSPFSDSFRPSSQNNAAETLADSDQDFLRRRQAAYSNRDSWDSPVNSDREMMDDGTTCFDWPPENPEEEEFYNVSGDSEEVQPRELDSDEDLYCCSLLEPIMEEDSDDFLSSSDDHDSLKHAPTHRHHHHHPHQHPELQSFPHPRSYPDDGCPDTPTNPSFIDEDEDDFLRTPTQKEFPHKAGLPSPMEVVEDVFRRESPLIPDTTDTISTRSQDADDSESDESVQTVIRRDLGGGGSSVSSGSSLSGSQDSSPLHGPRFSFQPPQESPLLQQHQQQPLQQPSSSESSPRHGPAYAHTPPDSGLQTHDPYDFSLPQHQPRQPPSFAGGVPHGASSDALRAVFEEKMQSLMARMAAGSRPEVNLQKERDIPVEVVESSPRDLVTHIPEDRYTDDGGVPQRDRNIPEYMKDSEGVLSFLPDKNIPQDRDSVERPLSYADEEEKDNYDEDLPKAVSNIPATLPTQVCKVEIGNEVRAPPPDVAPTLRTEPLSAAPSQAPDAVTQNRFSPGVAAIRIDPSLHVTAPVLQSQARSDERPNNTDTDVNTSLGTHNPAVCAESKDTDVKEPVADMQDPGSAGDSSEESESETESSEEYDTHSGDQRAGRDDAGKIDSSSPPPAGDKPTAIDSFLTEFEDEPFARRIGRGRDRRSPEPAVKTERADTLHAPQPVAQFDSGPITTQPLLAELQEEPFARRVSSRERPLEVPDSSRSPEHSAAKIPKKDSDDVYPRSADVTDTAAHEQSPEESDLHSESDTESESDDRSPSGSDIKSSIDAEREKENKLDSLLTEFEEEPFARRRGGSGRFSAPRETDLDGVPSRETKPQPRRETDLDSDSSAFSKPPLQELEQEPFPMRKWGSGRFTGSRETDIDAETPRGLETPPDRDMHSNRDSKVPMKPEPYLDELEEEPFSRRKRASNAFSAPRETNLDDVLPSKPQPSTPERDRKMAKKSDPFLEELDEEPFARRPRGRRDTPSMKSDNELDRSGRSSDFDRSAKSHDYDGSARRDDLDRSGKSHDLDRSGRSHDPDRSGRSRDLDRSGRSNDYDRSRKGSDHDRSDTESYRSGGRPDSDYDRNTRRKSETSSIDSFLTELDEEPFARRVGRRRRRRRSPDRTTPRNVPTAEPIRSDIKKDVREVVESPAMSKPSYVSSPPPKEDTKSMAVVPESPTVSLPPFPPSFNVGRGANITSTPQKPDTRVESRKSVPVPESPTISMPPVYEEDFPQARMCVNTVSTYTTTGGTSYSPFTDASVSDAVEQMPKGYSFVRCESEVTRSERRLVRVDRPLAPDFETLINSVPFTSETVGEVDDEDAVGFDDYSAFVQDLHRPNSETELAPLAVPTRSLPNAPSPLDDACILSGNLVSPPPVEVLEFPQHKHPRLPAVSSVAQRLHGRDDDSEDQGSDAGVPNYADRDKSSKAEASGSEGVLDASFDIDSTEAKDKMDADFAFLTSGESVRVPERVSAPPSDTKARRDSENIDDRMSTDERQSDEDDRDRRTDERSDDDEEEGGRRRRRRRRRKEGSGDRGDDRKRRRNNRRDREDDRNEYPEEMQDSRRDDRRRESPEREMEKERQEDRDRPQEETEHKVPSLQSRPERTITPPSTRTEPEKKFTSSEQARDVITKTEKPDTHVPVSDRPTAKLEEAAPLLFFQPAAVSEQVVMKTNTEPPKTQPQKPAQVSKKEEKEPSSMHLASPEDDLDLPFADSDEEMEEKAEVSKRPAVQGVPVGRAEERKEPVYRPEQKREQAPFRPEEKREPFYRTEEKREQAPAYRPEEKREQAPTYRTEERREPVYRPEEKRQQAPFRTEEKIEPSVKHDDRREPSFISLERGSSDRKEEKIELPKRSEVKREQPDRSDVRREPEDSGEAKKEQNERSEADREPSSPREERKTDEGAKSSLEPSPQIVITPDSSDRLATLPPRPKPRQMSLTRPTPMPRSKSLGDNISTATSQDTDDEDDVFQRGTSHTSDDSHSSLDDEEEEELAFTKKQSTPQTYDEKRPRSLKEIRRKMTQQRTNPRPLIAPFTLPDNMVLPSRLKIQAQRKQFLSSDNLDTKGLGGSLQDQFAAHKLSQQQGKERRYKSPNKKLRSPNFSSQDQLEKLHYMLNYSRHSESSFDRSLVDHLHEGCILTPQGRRSILDKTLSIENLQVDLPEHLRRYGSVTSLVETDIDTGETQETSFFPETNLDIFDCLFQPHEPLQRSASMSDMVLGDPDQGQGGEGQGQSEALDRSFHGLRMSLPPSQSHKSTGKGRFAYRKYQKSKSLCTLETNLDDVGEEGGGDGDMKRVPSVHELRVTKSLQKLNVPDWFKKSSLSKSSSCLLKYGSNSTMNSFTFSPSLLSSPCASTAPAPSNVVIKTRVVPPSSSRGLRSPALGSTTMLAAGDKKAPAQPVKLPSEKLREKEKNKSLMPIPIVPFAEIRAMFEKKGKGKKTQTEKEGEAVNAERARPTESARDVASPDRIAGKQRDEAGAAPKHGILKTPAVPSISISPEEEMKREQHQLHQQQQQQQQQQQREYRPPQQTFAVARDVQSPTVSIPAQAQPQTVHNGVSDGVSPPVTVKSVSPRTEQLPQPSIGRSVAEKPPPLSLSVDRKPQQEPARREDAQKSPPPSKDSQKDGKKSPPPKPQDSAKDGKKSPPAKDPKQQFSPGRSLRQFFGLSKDKSSERKSEGGGGSLDSSFSSGDGVYEKEPRRLGVSEISRRFESQPKTDSAASSSFERRSSGREGGRSDPDSSFSSGGEGGVTDTSAPSRGSGPPQPTSTSSFPASSGFRPPAHHHQNNNASDPVRQPGFIDYSRSESGKQPPFSRFNRPELDSSFEEPYSSRSRQPEAREPSRPDHPDVRDPPSFQRRLPGAGTSYGRTPSTENGDHQPDSLSVPTAGAKGAEKKSLKETTV